MFHKVNQVNLVNMQINKIKESEKGSLVWNACMHESVCVFYTPPDESESTTCLVGYGLTHSDVFAQQNIFL